VGLLTDLLGDPSMLRYAMTIQAAIVGVFALGIVALGMASFRRNVEELERLIDDTTAADAVEAASMAAAAGAAGMRGGPRPAT
jgi:hypothetical protein